MQNVVERRLCVRNFANCTLVSSSGFAGRSKRGNLSWKVLETPMGKEFEENVRLLLLDAPQQKDCSAFPSYFVTAFWWGFFFTGLTALLVLVGILTVSRYEGEAIFKHPIYLTQVDQPSVHGRSLMKQDNMLSTLLESSNNVFFAVNQPLDWRSSCSLESVLIQFGDKNVFLMAFHSSSDGAFEKKLRAEHSNLMMLRVDGHQYFKGSMFDGEWKGDSDSLGSAQLLTVWQFGGTVVSPDVVAAATGFPPARAVDCLVSEDMLSCPIQCSAFAYQLVLIKKSGDGGKDLVKKSVEEFCGNPVSCLGVQKLQPTCPEPKDGCFLVRLPEEPSPSNQTWTSLAHYCPVTYRTSKFPEAQPIIKRVIKKP